MDTKTLSEAIRTARRSKGWRQADLARKLGYKDNSMVAKLEKGDRRPGREAMGRLLGALPELGEQFPEIARVVASLRQNATLDAFGKSGRHLDRLIHQLQSEHRELLCTWEAERGLELERKSSEVWVVSRTLENDVGGLFRPIVESNLKAGKSYWYLTEPDNRPTAEDFLAELRGSLGAEAGGRLEDHIGVAFVGAGGWFFPLEEFVIYDPAYSKSASAVARGLSEKEGYECIVSKACVERAIRQFLSVWSSTTEEQRLGNRTGPRRPVWAK
jgi:transcriptional regulator with XRE-family HTH domain